LFAFAFFGATRMNAVAMQPKANAIKMIPSLMVSLYHPDRMLAEMSQNPSQGASPSRHWPGGFVWAALWGHPARMAISEVLGAQKADKTGLSVAVIPKYYATFDVIDQ